MEIQRNNQPIQKEDSPIQRNKPRGHGSLMGGSDYHNMYLPGNDFMQHFVAGSKPTRPGVYMIFYKYDPPSAWSNVKNSTGKATAHFDGEVWEGVRTVACTIANFTNGSFIVGSNVLGYIGPLPTLNLDTLLNCSPAYPINQTFYISTLEQAAKKLYSSGPHAEYMIAALRSGYDGEYIFVYDSYEQLPTPIAKYDVSKDSIIQWRGISKKDTKKIMKRMASYVDSEE